MSAHSLYLVDHFVSVDDVTDRGGEVGNSWKNIKQGKESWDRIPAILESGYDGTDESALKRLISNWKARQGPPE